MRFPSLCTSHYGWLAAYYSTLQESGSLEPHSLDEQVTILARAVEADYPAQAEEIRQWNKATRAAMLGVLDDLTHSAPVRRQTLLWQALKGERLLSCVAVQLPQGIDVQLLLEGVPERTALAVERTLATRTAVLWSEELALDGWLINGF